MGISSTIFGCSGVQLTADEKSFFKATQPWGFILFARNVETPEQVTRLVDELKACVDHDPVPILIDQEGGRVRRLRPPHWPEYHCGSVFGQRYEKDKQEGLRFAWLQSRLMAFDLARLGINVDCLPVLDVPVPGSHDVIGDRAYSNEPQSIIEIGKSASQGLLDGGVLPVIKHIPGHGRAGVDSHKSLPVVDASHDLLSASDFKPFVDLNNMPLAMTAHVVYSALDADSPATTSRTIIADIIRGEIGFDGALMSDDLSMHALSGDFSERTKSAFAAGCDLVLHCNGDMEEMLPIAENAPELAGKALERVKVATGLIGKTDSSKEDELRLEFAALGAGI